MASTYSNDLRIELIASGEQSGIWGNTTNNNLGTLLEDAISGTATVLATSTNYALTAFSGVADEARCAALNLNTLTNGAFNVYVPPVSKLYVVGNSSAYTCSIYVSTSIGNTTATAASAGAPYVLPAGATASIYCNGTVCIDAINQVRGNLAVNGNLSIAGTTTLSADPTLALQAVTKQYVDTAIAGGIPAGGLMMWPTASSPTGWLLCDGSAVSRTTYASLFGVVGTTFGAGNGTTTFNLPNYINRMPFGASAATTGSVTGIIGAVVTGSISTGGVLTVTAVTRGALYIGDIITGTNVPANCTITAFGTGTGGAGTYTVSPAPTSAIGSRTITSSSTVLNVTAVGSGTVAIGQALAGTGITTGTKITDLGTGAGLTGTYIISTAQNAASTTITLTAFVGIGVKGGTSDTVVASHTHTATSSDSGHAHDNVTQYGDPIQRMGGGTGRQAGTSPDSALGKSDNGSSTDSGNANITTTVASAGVSGVNQNLPPYLTINFIIKT
jgi:microcystin-dependent protein